MILIETDWKYHLQNCMDYYKRYIINIIDHVWISLNYDSSFVITYKNRIRRICMYMREKILKEACEEIVGRRSKEMV